jgi:hypothetical protein
MHILHDISILAEVKGFIPSVRRPYIQISILAGPEFGPGFNVHPYIQIPF